jgi:hypothetical protein
MISFFGNRGRVLFHKCCSITWVLLLIPSILWWHSSILWVIAISIYANIKSDWAAAEAADDRVVMGELQKMRAELEKLRAELTDQD